MTESSDTSKVRKVLGNYGIVTNEKFRPGTSAGNELCNDLTKLIEEARNNSKEWCDHIGFDKGSYWKSINSIAIHGDAGSKKFCPECGAKRPT